MENVFVYDCSNSSSEHLERNGLGKEIFIANVLNPFIPAVDTEIAAAFVNDIL